MAIRMTLELPAPKEQYDQVNQKLDIDSSWPDGLIVHSASVTDAGMRVVDIWESQEKFDAFNNGALMDALKEVFGPDMPPGNPPQIEELYNMFSQ